MMSEWLSKLNLTQWVEFYFKFRQLTMSIIQNLVACAKVALDLKII